MLLYDINEMRKNLEMSLYELERRRKRAEKEGYTLLEVEYLDKELEAVRNKLKEVMKSIQKQERQRRKDEQTFAELEQLLDRLGLKPKKEILIFKSGIDVAECLLAGYDMKGHSFYNLLHSEDPVQQKKAEHDIRLLKRFIKLCARAQVDY